METWSNMGILGWGLFLIHKVNLNVINEVNYNLFDFYFHRNHKFSRLWYADRDCGYTYLLKIATYELPIYPKGYKLIIKNYKLILIVFIHMCLARVRLSWSSNRVITRKGFCSPTRYSW